MEKENQIEREKSRISLDFLPEALEELNKLKLETKSATYSEVIRRALGLYSLYVDRKKEGWKLHYRIDDEDQVVELVF